MSANSYVWAYPALAAYIVSLVRALRVPETFHLDAYQQLQTELLCLGIPLDADPTHRVMNENTGKDCAIGTVLRNKLVDWIEQSARFPNTAALSDKDWLKKVL